MRRSIISSCLFGILVGGCASRRPAQAPDLSVSSPAQLAPSISIRSNDVLFVPRITLLDRPSNMSDGLDIAPMALRRYPPRYPQAMLASGVSATADVAFVVTLNGDVNEVFVVSPQPSRLVDEIVTTVSRWKYEPGKIGGRAVNTKVSVRIVFEALPLK